MHHCISVLRLLMQSTCTSPLDDWQPVTTVTQSDFKTPRSHGSKLTASVWSCDTWSSRDVCSNPSCRLTYREYWTPSSTLNLPASAHQPPEKSWILKGLLLSRPNNKAFSSVLTARPLVFPSGVKAPGAVNLTKPAHIKPPWQDGPKTKRKISSFSCPGVTLKIWKTISRYCFPPEGCRR